MSFENYVFLEFSELNSVVVICLHCKAEVILDAKNQRSELPETCPSCRTAYGLGLREAFEPFQGAYKTLSEKGAKVRALRPTEKQ